MTRASEIPAGRPNESEEAVELIRSRMRPALLIVIGMTVLAFMLAPQNAPLLVASRALQIGVCVLGVRALRFPGGRDRTICVALLVTCLLTITSSMQVAFLTTAFLAVLFLASMMIVIVAASLLPWGIPAQCALIAMSACTVVTALRIRGVPLASVQHDAITALASGYAFSIYIVHAMARLRADLRASEERWRARVENAFDYILQLSPSGRINYASPNLAHLGYPPQVLTGRSIFELVHPQERETAESAFARSANADVTGIALRFARPDGTFRWMEIAARTFTLSDVGPQIVAVCRDMTERRLSEQERELLIGELDAYARTVAHDLKNPIASIAAYTELVVMERERLSERGREFLAATEQSCRKMVQIIEELLLLARVRNVRTVSYAPLDMDAIVQDVLDRLSGTIGHAGARIEVPGTWPQALGYAPWVEEVWANYISNAVKYGGSPPKIELGAARDGDGKIRFWVGDNGAGLEDRQLASLFKEFSRVDSSRTEGHGLGLSIVKRIVEKLGGTVGAESERGAGSRFWFTLPES